jgi:hypothetical protein
MNEVSRVMEYIFVDDSISTRARMVHPNLIEYDRTKSQHLFSKKNQKTIAIRRKILRHIQSPNSTRNRAYPEKIKTKESAHDRE